MDQPESEQTPEATDRKQRERLEARYIRQIVQLQRQLIDRDQSYGVLRQYASDLERELQRKNAHIARLEELLKQFEQGRMMQLMRRLRRQPPPAPTDVVAPPVATYAPPAPPDPYHSWCKGSEPDAAALKNQRHTALQFTSPPLLSIITPVFDPPADVLQAAIDSVRNQSYRHWELCLVDGGSRSAAVRETLQAAAHADRRITVRFLDQNLGISGNSNQALAMASGEFVLLLDHDDLLAPNLLFEAARLLLAQPDLDVIYYDEDKISADGSWRSEPWFKPSAYSPELLLSVNYLMHCLIRRSLLVEMGGFDPQMDGAQDWDVALRLLSRTRRMAHIPQVLYHWRRIAGSAALDANAKPWAFAAQERAMAAHLARLGANASISSPERGRLRLHWPTSGARVSIIIQADAHSEHLQQLLTTLHGQITYPDVQIIVVANRPQQTLSLHIVNAVMVNLKREVQWLLLDQPLSWAAANNRGARAADGELLLFLDAAVAPLDAEWLHELAGWAEQPGVGVVGGTLLHQDGTIAHAGMTLGITDAETHPFAGERENAYGPFGSPAWYRDYLAVSGACLLTRRDLFLQLGGFDEAYQHDYADVEFCSRLVAAGQRVVYTPFARAHCAIEPRQSFPADALRLLLQLQPLFTAGDPYATPNLVRLAAPSAFSNANESADEYRLPLLKTLGLVSDAYYEEEPPPAPLFVQRSILAPARSTPGRRLALISHDLSFSGAPMILVTLARYLQEQGWQITVLSPDPGPLVSRYREIGIEPQVVPALRDDARIAAVTLASFDAVIVNTVMLWRLVYAARAVDVPCIWWIHESQLGQQLVQAQPVIGGAFAAATAVMFPSQATAALYTQFGAATRLVAIHYGLELARLRAPPAGDAIHAVVIGSIEPRKGQDVLLQAMFELPEDVLARTEFSLVGRVLDWDFYEQISETIAHLPHVHIIGEATPADVQAQLRAANLFILASRDEALPIVLLEAMAAGKPIVTTNAGGAAEAISDGAQGLVVPVEDHRAMAQAITRLVRNPLVRRTMGAAARARYVEAFTLVRFGHEVNTLLEQTIARPAAPGL